MDIEIINKINSLHKEAMDYAQIAESKEKENKINEAKGLFKKAFELERDAAWELIPYIDKEPSRSILFRSAASLAKKCGLINDAKDLIKLGLNGNPPGFIKEQLTKLLDSLKIKELTLSHHELRLAARTKDILTLEEENEIKKRFEDDKS